MKLRETTISLRRQVREIVAKQCLKLDPIDYKDPQAYGDWGIAIRKRVSLYNTSDDVVIVIQSACGKTRERKMLFQDANWSEIEIVVSDKDYYNDAMKIGEAYERLSGCEASIIKCF